MQGDINQPVKKNLIFVSEIINCIQTPEIRLSFTILCENIIGDLRCTMKFFDDFLFTFSQFKTIQFVFFLKFVGFESTYS